MAKINNNGITINDKTTGKTSAKKADTSIGNILNMLKGSMGEEAYKNASAIATIASLF